MEAMLLDEASLALLDNGLLFFCLDRPRIAVYILLELHAQVLPVQNCPMAALYGTTESQALRCRKSRRALATSCRLLG